MEMPSPDKSGIVLRCKRQDKAVTLYSGRKLAGDGVYSFELRWSDAKFSGCRTFLVAHWKALYQLMMARSPAQRRYYELIRKGAVCKLYFDLEFDKRLNAEVDGDVLTVKLIEFVCSELSVLSGVDVAYEDMLVLKSESAAKFSAHVICNADGVRFRDNLVCGRFVQFLMARDAAKELFYVNTGQCGRRTPFCDLSVYSQNRHFRLFRNTKHRKNCFLEIAEIDGYVETHQLSGDDEEIFRRSLICLDEKQEEKGAEHARVILSNAHIPPMAGPECRRFATVAGAAAASPAKVMRRDKSMAARAVDRLSADLLGLSIDNPQQYEHQQQQQQLPPPPQQLQYTGEAISDEASRRTIFRAPTVFRRLDELITSVVAPFGGRIHTVAHFHDSYVLTYTFVGYNFCANRGRNHRSNKVFFHVDLRLPGYMQKCFDTQDCAGYSSAVEPIPVDVAEETLALLRRIDDARNTNNNNNNNNVSSTTFI